MQHTIEDLIRRIEVMKDKAVMVHRLRNQYSDLAEQTYDAHTCRVLIEDIQSLALGIAHDREGTEIKTEMEYKNVKAMEP
jgi:hypothetical protein